MKNKNFIRDLQLTRGEKSVFLANFIINFARGARLMHKILPQFKNQEPIIQEAIRNYIISIASCLETFYRDIYVYVLSLDETILERVLPDLKTKTTIADIHSLLKDGVNFSEIAASEASFQSVAEIDSFMSKLFTPKSYFEELDTYSLDCLIPARSIRAKMELHAQWRSEFAAIFNYRHSLVHNANKSCLVDFPEIQKLEALALTVPQMTTELIAKKFPISGVFRMEGSPVLFLIEDMVAEDWENSDDKVGIQINKQGSTK